MPAYGPFEAHSISPEGPPTDVSAVSPADVDLPEEMRAFRVGRASGDVTITDRRGIVTVIHCFESTKGWLLEARDPARDPDGTRTGFKCSNASQMWLEDTLSDAVDGI